MIVCSRCSAPPFLSRAVIPIGRKDAAQRGDAGTVCSALDQPTEDALDEPEWCRNQAGRFSLRGCQDMGLAPELKCRRNAQINANRRLFFAVPALVTNVTTRIKIALLTNYDHQEVGNRARPNSTTPIGGLACPQSVHDTEICKPWIKRTSGAPLWLSRRSKTGD